MNSLDKIIEKLKSDSNVDTVFMTGSNHNKEAKTYSDADLVVIFKENKDELYCLYEWVDNIFAEVFFFDLNDLKRITLSEKLDAESFDAILLDWVKKSNIYFDKSEILTKLKSKAQDIDVSSQSDSSKEGFWQRTNHNYIVDKRYFESGDPLYHEALEIKLFYSMEQVICAYFAFRDIPWRGEKNAILYLQENNSYFYQLFKNYTSATYLAERFDAYSKMFEVMFTDKYKKWTEKDKIILKKDFSVLNLDDQTTNYINSLFNL